jgi:ABC-2 type transport system ATP-binding protein
VATGADLVDADASSKDDVTSSLLVVTEVTKSFRHGLWPFGSSVPVLRGASLEIGPGELVGLVGENGSGKSTLMKVIVGMLAPESGSVELRGTLGYCPQLPQLWEKLTVSEHLELFTNAYGLDRVRGRASTDRLLDELGFGRYLDYRIESLSGGTRQKLNLALSMLHEPDVLLLDEPYAGFDWETYLSFWAMSEQRRAAGMAILVVSHLIGERERLTRTYTLRDGRCVSA